MRSRLGILKIIHIILTRLPHHCYWYPPHAYLSETIRLLAKAKHAQHVASTHSTAWRVSSGPVLSLSFRLIAPRCASTVFVLMCKH
jgi:hypothetical protein